MESNPSHADAPRDDAWAARQRYWQRKLGRLRLGAEPLDVQVERYRRVTWMLTAVPLVIALIFIGLFTAFHRTLYGVVIAAILLLPIVAVAWIDFGLLRFRAARYTRELREHQERAKGPVGGRP
jgi:hypothetical protein